LAEAWSSLTRCEDVSEQIPEKIHNGLRPMSFALT